MEKRYFLYERADLNTRVIFKSSNKSEIKKIRTGYKYSMLLPHITANIYDNKTKTWMP